MRTARKLSIGLLTSLAVWGCGGVFGSGGAPDADLRTDRSRYTVRATTAGLEAEIPFAFANRTGRTVYISNCARFAPPRLEKRVEDEWVVAWRPLVPRCSSPPIAIRDGGAFQDTLLVSAGYPADDLFPKFEVDDLDGTYRLVWPNVLWASDRTRSQPGDALPRSLRTSNEFVIQGPR